MITYWQIFRNGLLPLNAYEKNCVVNVADPSHNELEILKSTLNIPADFLSDVMDMDERSRLEIEDDNLLVIYRIPFHSTTNGVPFTTMPLGIVLTKSNLVIICNNNNEILQDFFSRGTKNFSIVNKVDLILQLFIRSTTFYHRYLKQINTQTNIIEKDLEKSTRNKELHKLLKMEKCLVYFTTSLRSNELLMSKLRNSKFLQTNEYTEDLMDEAIIENRQAIEMANIYSDIQSGMMDAFASVISNNLNIVLKQLTIITIILMIPTLIASFFGMNVPNFMENSHYAFAGILVVSVLLSIVGVILFRKKKWM